MDKKYTLKELRARKNMTQADVAKKTWNFNANVLHMGK